MRDITAPMAAPIFQATCYGKTITAHTFTELNRKASIIANKYWRPVDKMAVTNNALGLTRNFYRFNRKYPNGAIEYGKWC